MVETTLRTLLHSALAHESPIGPIAENSLQAQTRMMLLDALCTLPPRGRAVVVLRYWAALSQEQVADMLGCSTGTVSSHIACALDTLRAVLGASESGAPQLAAGRTA
jgi:RNA polymerase sigma factor (sigma-70 family)